MRKIDETGRRRRIAALAVLFGGFLSYGLTNAVTGPVLPHIGEDLGVSYTALSLLVTLLSAGYTLGVFLGGRYPTGFRRGFPLSRACWRRPERLRCRSWAGTR